MNGKLAGKEKQEMSDDVREQTDEVISLFTYSI
jgi:hypothetical protein